ncbi:MAG: trehalose-phosphatase [Verrucomicrobium sp.]|nr:trehalose-phosphatase [Verrucomicrobium sp.]
MIPVFSEAGLRILESLSFTRTLFAFDYDGTLSRIVDAPEDAAMTAAVAELTEELGRRVPLAVVSGRSVVDLRRRLPFEPAYLVGNHGLEGAMPNPAPLRHFAELCRSWRLQMEASLPPEEEREGVVLEDKALSLALHYRHSRRKKEAKQRILELSARLDPPPRVILGKCVVNLVAEGGPHKGIALQELLSRSGAKAALYVGDDDTDEDAFSLGDPRIIGVRIGYRESSQAQFYIKSQAEMARLLKTLLGFIVGHATGEPLRR